MHATKSPIYQTSQIREFERLAKERFAIDASILMQRAGQAAFDFLLHRWPQAQKIAIVCGSGNNGGDGYVLALLAARHGLQVSIWQIADKPPRTAIAQQALLSCQKAHLAMQVLDSKQELDRPDVIVDAICGIGLDTPLHDNVVTIIKRLQRLQVPIFALDVPTGINANTGKVMGAALAATATLTFIGFKLGLMTSSGVTYTGELALNDLQLPTALMTSVRPIAETAPLTSFSSYLKPRPRDWHKGLSGHVLIIGGDSNMTGAPRLAGMAALRVGAGLVTIATRSAHAAYLNSNCPELMCHGVETSADLTPALKRADVVVIGPGLGQSPWAQALLSHVIQQPLALVIDADGLNLLAKQPSASNHWVLTPHPLEAARLLGLNSSERIQEDRLAASKALAERYGGIIVLKGAGSLVLAPEELPALCDKGNPGMATAGMGDILSGVIGGLIAQGIPLGDAAKLGVTLHALAGDLAAKEGERGIIATDLLPHLHRLCNG